MLLSLTLSFNANSTYDINVALFTKILYPRRKLDKCSMGSVDYLERHGECPVGSLFMSVSVLVKLCRAFC